MPHHAVPVVTPPTVHELLAEVSFHRAHLVDQWGMLPDIDHRQLLSGSDSSTQLKAAAPVTE